MTTYRVTVLREGVEADETLFEIAGSAALVQQLVPGVLDTVLAEPAPGGERSLADRVFDSAVAAGVAAEQQAAGPDGETAEQATKRKRRTKAEIAADKEAQALGFRDAAHRTVAEQSPSEPRTEAAAPAPSGSSVQQEPPVVEQRATTVTPPYNPFTQ